MEFLDKTIEEYILRHTSAEPALLKKLNRETHANVNMPRMLSGHLQGRLLALFSHMIRPHYILEIGTFTGYSALCMAEGLAEGGKLITIDNNGELEGMVRKYVGEAGLDDKIELRIGNAADIIPTLGHTFDLVFIDADKTNYLTYYRLILPKVNSGGFILVDNVLWSGKVADMKVNDKDTLAIRQFNEEVLADKEVESVLLPVRDGLMALRKK